MTTYYTYKDNVPIKPGQTLGYTAGKGYYAAGTPTPAKPSAAPQPVSDAASGGGYAKPAATQPTAATKSGSAPQPVSDAASGGGYATPAATQPKAAVSPPTAVQPRSDAATGGGYGPSTPTVVLTPQARSDAATGSGYGASAITTTKASTQPTSDAASSGGYGTRYYTFPDQVDLQPGQHLAFASGRGYYAAGTSIAPKVVSPPLHPGTADTPVDGGATGVDGGAGSGRSSSTNNGGPSLRPPSKAKKGARQPGKAEATPPRSPQAVRPSAIAGRGSPGTAQTAGGSPRSDAWGTDQRTMTSRQRVLFVAYLALAEGGDIRYSQGPDRMSGIADRVKAPETPAAADCSAFATWVYYAAGAPNPNGGRYSATQTVYTGTLWEHGSAKPGGPKPGDLVFFGNPYASDAHVAIYIGNGECISQGGPEPGPRIETLAAEGAYENRGYYGYRSYVGSP